VSEVNTISLDRMSREELIAHARELSINRPDLMTRVELRDEIIRLSETDEEQRKRARGWLGVARDLVASVVEQRLNLPDAAEMIRGANLRVPRHVPPVATVTLAEIYAAQGHLPRAIKLLDEVLLREPDHVAAAALRATLIEQQVVLVSSDNPDARSPSIIPEPEEWVNTLPPPDVTVAWPAEFAESVDVPAGAAVSAETATSPAEALRAKFEAYSKIAGIAQVIANEGAVKAAAVAGEAPVSEPAAAEDEVAPPAPVKTGSSDIPGAIAELESATVEPNAVLVENESAACEPELESLETTSAATSEVVDEVLLYRRSNSTIVCHWSLSADSWESRQAHGRGQWVVRVFQVKATAGPLESNEADIELPGTSGEILLNDIESSQHVRMAIGWKAAEHFSPAIIGVEIVGEAPEQLSIAWSPLPSAADPPPELWLDHARRSWQALSMGTTR
jgi:hypothetical protein